MAAKSQQPITRFDIPVSTIVKVVLTILLLFFLWTIRDIIMLFLVSLVLAFAFDRPVDYLQRYHIPRGISILGIYIIVIGIFGSIIAFMIPSLITQFDALTQTVMATWDSVSQRYFDVVSLFQGTGLSDNLELFYEGIKSQIGQASSGGVVNFFSSFFGAIAWLFLVLTTTFYLVIEEGRFKRFARSFLPDRYQPFFNHVVNQVQENIGLWLRGQIVLALIIGFATYIGLLILGVEFALVLAVFAGVMEWVPYFGPAISSIPAIIIGLSISPFKALAVAILYMIIQVLENNLIVPKVMQKSVGLNPLVVIFVILIGFQIGGIVGILLSVPVAGALQVIIKEIFQSKESKTS